MEIIRIFDRVLEAITYTISGIAVVLILIGLLGFIKRFYRLKKKKSEDVEHEAFIWETREIRLAFGIYILFALEMLLAADIVSTIYNRSLDNLLTLFGIVIIRTLVAYFFDKEMTRVEACFFESKK